MTREEAIRELKIQFIGEFDSQREAKEMAIKALEQEPVLDKIRAEIEFEVDHRTNMLCAEDVFEIIDKYKAEAESEGSEDNDNNKDIEDNLLKLYYQLIKTSSGGAELNLKNGDKLIVQLVRPIHLNIINNTMSGGKDNDKSKEDKDR